MNIKERIAV